MIKFLILFFITNGLYSSILSQAPHIVLQQPHKNPISYIGFNQNNGLLYTYSAKEKLIKIWNPKYGKLVKEIDLSFTNSTPYCYLLSHGKSIAVYDNNGIHLLSDKGDKISDYNRVEDDQSEQDTYTGNIVIIHKDGTADILNTETGFLTRIVNYVNQSPVYCINANGILTYSTSRCAYAFDMKDATIIDSISLSHEAYQTGPSSMMYVNNGRTKIALITQQETYFLSVKTHDTTGRLSYHRGLYSFRNEEWFTPGMEKLLFISNDTLNVLNVESGKNEAKFPVNMNWPSVKFLSPNFMQFQAIGYTLLFDWQKNKFVFKTGLLMDDIVHLSGESIKYKTSVDGQNIYSFYSDTLMSINLENTSKTTKIKTSFIHDIKSICTDNSGSIYITGMDQNQNVFIQKWDALTLKLKSIIPDVLPVGYQETAWANFDSVGNLVSSGDGVAIKKWSSSTGTVDSKDASSNALVINDQMFVTQDNNDTGRIILQCGI